MQLPPALNAAKHLPLPSRCVPSCRRHDRYILAVLIDVLSEWFGFHRQTMRTMSSIWQPGATTSPLPVNLSSPCTARVSEDAAREQADAGDQNKDAVEYEHDGENKGNSQNHENDAENDRGCVLEHMY